jgi:hypothetical protein
MGSTVFYASTSELATLTNTFRVGATPTDPTTITLTITDPTGAATAYTYGAGQITRSGAGVYTKDVTCSTSGTWAYLWEGTGSASDAEAGTWQVDDPALGRLYATPAALASRLGVSVTTNQAEMVGACYSASRAIEHYCQRAFWRTPTGTARTFEPDNCYRVRLPVFCDLVSVSALATDEDGDGTWETTWVPADYQLLPLNPTAAPETRPYTEIEALTRQFPVVCGVGAGRRDRLRITGVWGWPAVPYGIVQATLILAAETYRLKDAPAGGAIGFADIGVVRIRENPQVRQFADPYRRKPALVA